MHSGSLDAYYFDRIAQVLDDTGKSSFWSAKLAGRQIRSISDFRHAPLTTREEINALYDNGRWSEMLTELPCEEHILVTSGGRPYRSPFVSCLAKHELDEMVGPLRHMFFSPQAERRRILIAFPGVMPYPASFAKEVQPISEEEYQSRHVSGILFKYASIQCHLDTYCTGLRFLAYKVSAEEATLERERIMAGYTIVKPHILAASPNVLRSIFFHELGRNGKRFQDYNTSLVISGGSKLSETDYETLADLGDPAVILWVESGELGTIAYSSPFRPSKQGVPYYSTFWRGNFLETVDADGNPLPFARRGRMVATRLYTHVQPLIRYDLEDEGRFFIKNGVVFLSADIVKL